MEPYCAIVASGGGAYAPPPDAVRGLCDRGATALLSVGVCGGLDPVLPVGALIIPEVVIVDGVRFASDPALSARLGTRGGVMLAADAPLARREAKAAAFAAGACAVDLETGVLAQVAAEMGLPWAALRIVCDPAWRDLPRAASAALDARGRIRPLAVLRALSPGQVPGLLRVGLDAARARKRLSAALRLVAWP